MTIVKVGRSRYQADLNFSADGLQWVISTCTRFFGGSLQLRGLRTCWDPGGASPSPTFW
ncbi:hypothetical protein ACIPSA_36310 [Streptomyces sp. NPDC086549]|uniref:hypothetical protein n=1 Tax=Streptomyces sp. NPDC086549 TaxID=3365752 RepID=UPI00382AE79C